MARSALRPLVVAHFLFDAIQGVGQSGYDAAW
jgi:hypothetical protein